MEWQPQRVETKWKEQWKEWGLYKVSNSSPLPKYYVLDMFPYPSGSGLHVGHPLGYIASDIFSRYKRLNGYNVLHPMGYDAFGLPAEQYALQTGVHPAVSTDTNISQFRRQLDNLGFSYDWSREIRTSDPTYYKWTQWIFLKLFSHYYDLNENKALPIAALKKKFETQGTEELNAVSTLDFEFTADSWKTMSIAQQEDVLMNFRLMYRKTGIVNWCEELGTVLANDEVKDGVSERGGFPVIKKPMMEWSMRTTAYAERLLNGLDEVNWPESLKMMQRNWIGKSKGALIDFQIASNDETLRVFTTRPDTIFGVTFMVIAPEHPMVSLLTAKEQSKDVSDYVEFAKTTNIEQTNDKTMTGVFTGSYVKHPFTSELIPIWISDYVLMEYGTGAIMAVPGGDERDFRFAATFSLPIITILEDNSIADKLDNENNHTGKLINSDFLNGLTVKEAIQQAIIAVEDMGIGKSKVSYKLRDANYSRQRYWGEPFPIVYDNDGLPKMLSDDELPLKLPNVTDFKPTRDGNSPLAKATEWMITNDGVLRETDTMPGFAGSSWYYLRYMDPDNAKALVSNEAINYWQNVDVYIGGSEHAVGHLLYSRMWHKFLFDLGVTVTNEPFERLINQGMIQGVSEKVYYLKDKRSTIYYLDGNSIWQARQLDHEAQVFISRDLIGVYPTNEKEKSFQFDAVTLLPVNIDFVNDYGTIDGSFLNQEGIDKFVSWRPDFAEAVFVTRGGYFEKGTYTKLSNTDGDNFFTHSEVEKMSKSKYNVINPDDVSAKYGADVFRMFEMFLGPIEQSKPWNASGIEGVNKFLRRFWSLFFTSSGQLIVESGSDSKIDQKIIHKTIKKLTEDIEKFSFNTCVSALMIATNELKESKALNLALLKPLIVIIAPFAPFLSEELWSLTGGEGSVHNSKWPEYDESLIVDDTLTYPVCINGKKRDLLEVSADAEAEAIKSAAIQLESIQKWLDHQEPKKIVFVPGKMVNIVI